MDYIKDNCYLVDNCKLNSNCKYVECTCIRFFKIDFLLTNALLSDNQKVKKKLVVDENGVDKDKFEQLLTIQKNIKSFVDSGNNLYIHSCIPGNGKTSWAIRLLQAYIHKIWPESPLECRCLFINVPKFLLELKSNISKHSDYIEFINENILKADLVVWDDIATKSATEFEHEHLLSLIDNRLFENKSNIFTSNINPENLSLLLGDRLASRIKQSKIIEFKGKDKRGVVIT